MFAPAVAHRSALSQTVSHDRLQRSPFIYLFRRFVRKVSESCSGSARHFGTEPNRNQRTMSHIVSLSQETDFKERCQSVQLDETTGGSLLPYGHTVSSRIQPAAPPPPSRCLSSSVG